MSHRPRSRLLSRLRCTSLPALAALVTMPAALSAQVVAPAPAPAREAITIHLVDDRGQPIAVGTEVVVSVSTFPDPAAPAHWLPSGMSPVPSTLVVGRGGVVHYLPEIRGWGGIEWLRVQRTAADGRGPRAMVPLRKVPPRVALLSEQRLAAGTIADGAGAPVWRWAARLDVVGADPSGVPVAHLLEPRWVLGDGTFELWGWRADGPFWLHATYAHLGPAAPRVELVFGATDVKVTMPTTGHVQVRLATPKPFPEHGAAFAVLRDLDRGGVMRQFLIPDDATNIRTLVGRFAVTLELNGVVFRDCGTLTVAHNQTTEVAHDLRPAVRLFRLEVRGPDGTPEPAARVRVVGSPDEPMARQPVEFADGRRHAFVVATTLASVDVEVSRFGGTQTVVVKGVDGDRVVDLPAERR